MKDKAQSNSMWQANVRRDLSEGWGVEDIAVRRAYDVNAVRAEVEILRATGELEKLVRK